MKRRDLLRSLGGVGAVTAVGDQLAWLNDIGSIGVDVFWKHCNFAVYGGTKP